MSRQDFLTRDPQIQWRRETPSEARARVLAAPKPTHCWVCKQKADWLYDCDGCGRPTCSECLSHQESYRGEDYSGCSKCERRQHQPWSHRRFPRRNREHTV